MTKVQILFVLAFPEDEASLRFLDELKLIQDVAAQKKPKVELEILPPVYHATGEALMTALCRNCPDILHFIGHGDINGNTILEDKKGNSNPVSSEAFSFAIGRFSSKIKCVILNSCFSEETAVSISFSGIRAIGMFGPIKNNVAVTFSTYFYESLASGRSYNDSFEIGISTLGISGAGEDICIPRLYFNGKSLSLKNGQPLMKETIESEALEKNTTNFDDQSSSYLVRSNNLQVKKEFTDQDKDQFLRNSFNYIATFFENSLEELKKSNPELASDFTRLNRQHFSAIIYRNGKNIAECQIWFGRGGGFGNGISYSNQISSTNSMNEQVTVTTDEHSLFLKSLGMSCLSGFNPNQNLSMENGAEYFWAIFIRRLQ